ncbi:Phosphoprotein phosphatase [Bertholletia excelsa]
MASLFSFGRASDRLFSVKPLASQPPTLAPACQFFRLGRQEISHFLPPRICAPFSGKIFGSRPKFSQIFWEMGACCSRGGRFQGSMVEKDHYEKAEGAAKTSDDQFGNRVSLEGSSKFISMFTQGGRKGINQDAMTAWENFNAEKGLFFCAVSDGHGPFGHKVSQFVRDNLPPKLCSSYKQSQTHQSESNKGASGKEGDDNDNSFFSNWKDILVKSYHEMDDDLLEHPTLEAYCSGTTTVAVLKKGEHLVVANLGDSRAVLGTRDEKDQLIPVQLTVDLKPNLPREEERIKRCGGRVFALEEEPEVLRIWMRDEDCPGLAMARAFGDFCLKDCGLISTPDVSCRMLTNKDEFIVLATDGVWDVLSNEEVVRIIGSARNRSFMAKILVEYAVQAWRDKYATSMVDDCTVVCLFLENQPTMLKSLSDSSAFTKHNVNLKACEPSCNLDTVVDFKNHGIRSRKPAKDSDR